MNLTIVLLSLLLNGSVYAETLKASEVSENDTNILNIMTPEESKSDTNVLNLMTPEEVTNEWLKNKTVTTDDCHGVHPQWHHCRKVERGNPSNDTQRLKFAPRVYIWGNIFTVLAF